MSSHSMFDRYRHKLYSSLDRSKKEIRLLSIHRHDPSSDIVRTSLFTCPLDSRQSFDALSYVWGQSVVQNKVCVNGLLVSVTQNLYEALLMLRQSRDSYKSIWIDGLCINQQDESERNHQVTLMREIYSNAEIVHIWFGQSCQAVDDGLALIDRLADLPAAETQTRDTLGELFGKEGLEGAVAGMKAILRYSWWTRLWVLQEVTLCDFRAAIANFGACSIEFHRLLSAAGWLYRVFAVLYRDSDSGIARLIYSHLLRFIELRSEKQLTSLLFYTHGTAVTVPHDRIYGLLGLLPPGLDTRPDYALPLETVYEDFTVALLQQEKSLDVLALSGLQFLKRQGLPSWVPAYELPAEIYFDSEKANAGLVRRSALITNYPRTLFHYSQPKILEVQAVFIDKIFLARPWNFSNFGDDDKFIFLADARAGDEESFITVVARAFKQCLQDFCQSASKVEALEIYATLGDLDEREIVKISQLKLWSSPFGSARDEALFRLFRWIYSLNPSEHLPICGAYQNLCFAPYNTFEFWTGEQPGRSCVAMGSAQEGDSLAILAGASVPFVLRAVPLQERRFELVGWADVKGVMDGEAVHETALQLNGDRNNLSNVFTGVLLV